MKRTEYKENVQKYMYNILPRTLLTIQPLPGNKIYEFRDGQQKIIVSEWEQIRSGEHILAYLNSHSETHFLEFIRKSLRHTRAKGQNCNQILTSPLVLFKCPFIGNLIVIL